MKKLLLSGIILLLLASCATQRGSARYTTNTPNRPKSYFYERVFDKFRRKPMSQRRKYQRPMRRTCYVFIEADNRDGLDLSFRIVTTKSGVLFRNSDCVKYTYDLK